MKRYVGKSLGISFVAMLILAMIPIFPVVAPTSPTIYLDPSDYKFDTDTVSKPCYAFNVTVKVSDVTDLAVYQITIIYNDTIINATQWWEPTWDPTYVLYNFKPTLPVPAPPNVAYAHLGPGLGSATVGAGPMTAPSHGFDGSGLLCIIEFHVKEIPGKGETLSCDLNINNVDTFLLDHAGGEIADVVKLDGYYQLKWMEPSTRPYFAVDPTLKEFGPYPPSAIGEAFDINVYIKNLSGAWGVTNATLSLCYNTTVIDVIGGDANVTINTAVWDGSYSVTVTHGDPDRVDITVRTTGTPSGDVLVATIKFTVMMQGESPPRPAWDFDESPLTFCDLQLWDHSFDLVVRKYTNPPENGLVKVYCLLALPLPWMEVVDPTDGDHEFEFGPEPSIGVEFDVDIRINDLHFAWYLIAYEFRLGYDDHLLEVVDITEGPFLTDPKWNKDGTLFISYAWNPPSPPEIPYPNAVVGGLLLPDFTQPSPDYEHLLPDKHPDTIHNPAIDNTLATIRFKIIKQVYPETLSCPLDLYYLYPPHETDWLMDKYGDHILLDHEKNINGTYSITTTPLPGRMIDVYGGLEGTYFPAPYGGQGLNMPMDVVWPQKQVCLYANVTYNFWPVQQKVVGFEVEGPFNINLVTDNLEVITEPVSSIWWQSWPYWDRDRMYHLSSWVDEDLSETLSVGDIIDTENLRTGDIELWYVVALWFDEPYWYIEIRPVYYPTLLEGQEPFLFKGTAISDEDGVAKLHFRMPWPCDNPEGYFGIYKVTATVDIACNVVTDVLYFHYDYLVRVIDITTYGGVQDEGLYFKHSQSIGIKIKYSTHSMQDFPLLISAFVKDELDVPIGMALITLEADGGATWCKYKTGGIVVWIHVPKFAFAGTATIHVNCFNKDPTEGGFAYYPEYAPAPEVFIQPF